MSASFIIFHNRTCRFLRTPSFRKLRTSYSSVDKKSKNCLQKVEQFGFRIQCVQKSPFIDSFSPRDRQKMKKIVSFNFLYLKHNYSIACILIYVYENSKFDIDFHIYQNLFSIKMLRNLYFLIGLHYIGLNCVPCWSPQD